MGTPYQDATFRFALPERAPVACDFGNFSIWCRYASQLFTVLEINSTIFVSIFKEVHLNNRSDVFVILRLCVHNIIG